MEKSIENIWKEGFLKNDALVAPKLNNLYKQKSKHIIDKFNRMFEINLIALVIGSIAFLIASFPLDIPVMGVGYFWVVNAIVIVNRKLWKSLHRIDKNLSSYQYLKDFNNWMKEQLKVNRRMAKIYYPLFFLFMMLGFWFSSNFQKTLGEILPNMNEMHMIFGVPLLFIIPVFIITGLLAWFGDRIYNFDVGLIYGRVFRKLDELIADIEELRS